jgi:AraC-like DNA-binding protein
MQYKELAPGAGARRLAQSYWRFQLGDEATESAPHVIVPDGMTSLSVAVAAGEMSPLLITGPTRRAHEAVVHPGFVYAGVRLQPECGALLLGVPAAELRGRLQPCLPPMQAPPGLLAALAGYARTGEAGELDSLLAGLGGGVTPDAAVGRVAARLVETGGRGQIRDLAAKVGISERQLRRRFFEASGMTPKEFAGVRRLREACILAVADQHSWAEAAAATDYADQSHLSRDVREAFAQTPRRIARYLSRISHSFPV